MHTDDVKTENNNPNVLLADSLFSGFYDKKKKPINEGDIVRFYFDADYGYGNKKSGFTEIIDVCWKDKDGTFYLISNIGLGAFVYRHNDYCDVIGNVYQNKNLLKDFSVGHLEELFPKINFR